MRDKLLELLENYKNEHSRCNYNAYNFPLEDMKDWYLGKTDVLEDIIYDLEKLLK